nr:hypothetical protein [Lachnospiraceae bacterium]
MERNDPNTRIREKIYKELKVTFLSVEQQIREMEEHRTELEVKCELFEQCLSNYLLSSGSDVVKEHLMTAKTEIATCELELEKLKMTRDAYKIEIEMYETMK